MQRLLEACPGVLCGAVLQLVHLDAALYHATSGEAVAESLMNLLTVVQVSHVTDLYYLLTWSRSASEGLLSFSLVSYSFFFLFPRFLLVMLHVP